MTVFLIRNFANNIIIIGISTYQSVSFIIELINHIRNNVTIPVIASSGAGKVENFSEVFEKTKAEVALATGIFYREEVPIEAVKIHMRERGIELGRHEY